MTSLRPSGSEEGVKKSIQVIEQLFQMADRGSSIDEDSVRLHYIDSQ